MLLLELNGFPEEQIPISEHPHFEKCPEMFMFNCRLCGCVIPVSPSRPKFAHGRIGNPLLKDHPKDQPLCLVDWTSRVMVDMFGIMFNCSLSCF